ncbi:MAG: hypothetical protein J0L64_20645 [Acidobacteria bacterium]|nr:hypothetical protein [Acidobacteriota bacterium]
MILLVDDDFIAVRAHIRELREHGLPVELRNTAERALTDFQANLAQWTCAIVDIMMAAPAGLEEAPGDGLSTGIHLASRMRKDRPGLPIIFLTNQRDAAILNQAENFAEPCLCIDKREMKIDEFRRKVVSFLREVGAPGVGSGGSAPPASNP